MALQEILIAEVVLDEGILPRRISNTKVRRYRDALKTGAVFPPIVVCEITKKLISGRHRMEAHRLEGHTSILADLRPFETDAERFEVALAENADHGYPLDPYEVRQAVVTGEELGVSVERVASLLHVPAKDLKRRSLVGYHIERVGRAGAPAGRKAVALKRTMAQYDGQELTDEQFKLNQGLSGIGPAHHARQLTMMVNGGVIVPTRSLVTDVYRCWQVLGAWLNAVAEDFLDSNGEPKSNGD